MSEDISKHPPSSDETQHSDAVSSVDFAIIARLNVGREDSTMSTKRFGKSELPIVGGLAEEAPDGAQSV